MITSIEQEIMDKIHNLDDQAKRRVLDFVNNIHISTPRLLTAHELMQLPFEERERLVKMALESSADEDFETFEAYTEDDFDNGS
jgi:hypothetical protein